MSAAAKTAAAAAPLHVTAAQAELLFSQIATVANVSCSLATAGVCHQTDTLGSVSVEDLFFTLKTVFRQIGALADVALGESVMGNIANWSTAPGYSEAGQ